MCRMEIALPTPGIIGRIEKVILACLNGEAEEWVLCLNALSKWEDERLLDNPVPELLEQHKQTIEHLLKVGRLLESAMDQPDFPDHGTLHMVRATQQALQFKMQMWHGSRMAREKSDQILAKCVPDNA